MLLTLNSDRVPKPFTFKFPNLVPRAHVPFGQHQDTELWNNQFPETKILGLPASRRMPGLVYKASRDKVDVDTFHKGIQYALEKLGKSKFGFENTTVSNFNAKSTKALGTSLLIIPELDQKARGLWERDCKFPELLMCKARIDHFRYINIQLGSEAYYASRLSVARGKFGAQVLPLKP